MDLKALMLEESKGATTFIDMGLEGFPQAKLGSRESDPDAFVDNGYLDLHPLNVKMVLIDKIR